MIEREGFFMIKDLKSKGLSTTQIAEICDLDRKTVSKWVKAKDIPTNKLRALVKSKLDDYKTTQPERFIAKSELCPSSEF